MVGRVAVSDDAVASFSGRGAPARPGRRRVTSAAAELVPRGGVLPPLARLPPKPPPPQALGNEVLSARVTPGEKAVQRRLAPLAQAPQPPPPQEEPGALSANFLDEGDDEGETVSAPGVGLQSALVARQILRSLGLRRRASGSDEQRGRRLQRHMAELTDEGARGAVEQSKLLAAERARRLAGRRLLQLPGAENEELMSRACSSLAKKLAQERVNGLESLEERVQRYRKEQIKASAKDFIGAHIEQIRQWPSAESKDRSVHSWR
mmetsp:Transcript_20442/g.66382  ORF Transcript_20442/g.66382 Transcript_20442/m.66382 type:complete len:264 (+) Transcript_20442:21-812(+)